MKFKKNSSLSVGLADVWPCSIDSYSYHLVHTPPVHFVGPPYHLLRCVPSLLCPRVSSACCAAPHMLKQCLTTFGQCTLNLLTNVPMYSPQPSCLWISCSLLFSVVFCCRVSPSMASRQMACHPERNIASLVIPPPGAKVAEALRCHPQFSSSTCLG